MEENETQGQMDFQLWCSTGSDYVRMQPVLRLSDEEMDERFWCGTSTPQLSLQLEGPLKLNHTRPLINKPSEIRTVNATPSHEEACLPTTKPALRNIGPSVTFIQLPPSVEEVQCRIDKFIVSTLGMPHPAWRKKEPIAVSTLYQRCKEWLRLKNENTTVLVKDLIQRLRVQFPKLVQVGPRRTRSFELRWLVDKNAFPTLFQLVILYLLREAKADWNAFWTSSCTAQLDPSSLQHILDFGQRQCPEIGNSNDLLLRVLQARPPSDQPAGASKVKYAPCKQGTKRPAEIVQMSSEQTQVLLDLAKNVFSCVNANAKRIRKLPKDLNHKSAVVQTQQYWLPLLHASFGSLEHWTSLFVHTPEGKDALMSYLHNGHVPSDVREYMTALGKPCIKDYYQQAEEKIWEVSASVLSGGTTSAQEYHRIRMITLYERDTSLQPCTDMSKLLCTLPGAIELQQQVLIAILHVGGGWEITNWNDEEFVRNILGINIMLDTVTNQQMAQQYLWSLVARKQHCGTHLRTLYLLAQQKHKTNERQQLLQTAMETLVLGLSEQKRWERFVRNDHWSGVPDAAFFAYLWWRREIRGKRKAKRRRVMGVPIPGLPSLKEAKQETRRLAVGQWNKNDKLDTVTLSLGKQAELFAAGHFPIGKIWQTKEEGTGATCYASRIVPLATALTWLTINADRNKLFIPEFKHIDLEFAIWCDGTQCLKHPILACLVFLLWNTKYAIKSDAQWMDTSRFFPVLLSVAPENGTRVQEVMSWVNSEVKSLSVLHWREKEYSFTWRALTADNSCLQKMLGNLGGNAHQRCSCCGINFADIELLWKFTTIEAAKPKSIIALAQAWADGTAKDLGMKTQSPIIPSSDSLTLDPEVKKWAEQFLFGSDSLHNTKGHWVSILGRLRGMKGVFDYKVFSNLVDQHVQRRLASELDGAHMRELAIRWKQVLMPALMVPNKERPAWEKFFTYWTEIQWIMYQGPEARNYRGLRLRLHVLTFLYFGLCHQLFPDTKTIKRQRMLFVKKDLCEQVLKHYNGNTKEANRHCRQRFGKQLQRLKLAELATFLNMPSVQEDATIQKSIDTLYDLYLHNLVAHIPDCFEVMDLRNLSTERGEGFFAFMKHVLLRLTGRDLRNEQVLREVLIRFSMGAFATETAETNAKLTKLFSDHIFVELVIQKTQDNEADTVAFLRGLLKWNYHEGKDWKCIGDEIQFVTLFDTNQVFKTI